MAMFARRVLQTMLDHLAAQVPLEGRKKLAHELNRQSSSALGFEWETAVLFGFSHIGKIDYEAVNGYPPRPMPKNDLSAPGRGPDCARSDRSRNFPLLSTASQTSSLLYPQPASAERSGSTGLDFAPLFGPGSGQRKVIALQQLRSFGWG